MAKADMHVHSSYSEHPSTWFLQRLGTRESYVDPETVYRRAKEMGMDFVTITDHNCIEGSLMLKERHPEDVFTGVEVTTYFPEDGRKVHVLVYGLDGKQFAEIDKARTDIYRLRDCLKSQGAAHAVAHATFSINGPMTLEHVERLMLLFDSFEGINGSRNRFNNEIMIRVLSSLTPAVMHDLCRTYRIEPFGDRSWEKGIVGGSDDHSGLFIGKAHTIAEDVHSPGDFVECVRRKATSAGGRHNDYRALAFAIYKVAYDFSKSRSTSPASSIFSTINHLLFEEGSMTFRHRLTLEKLKLSRTMKEDRIKAALLLLVDSFQTNAGLSIEEKLDVLNARITDIADDLLRTFLDSLGGEMREGDMMGLIRNVCRSLPGMFLSAPFFTTVHVLNESRSLVEVLEEKYVDGTQRKKKRILWFTDTLTDLNGVSATLTKLGHLARERELDLILVGCLGEEDDRTGLPPNTMLLPCIYTYTPSYFSTYTLRVPSVASSVKLISDSEPDEIYVSTPGPVGLLGLGMSKLLHVQCTNVYHTDFTRQARQIIGDEAVCRFVEDALRLFYNNADTIAVPSSRYMSLLERRGLDKRKMVRFIRGIDPVVFSPREGSGPAVARRIGPAGGVTFMYSGRISREKNMDFLAEVYERVVADRPDVNLLLAGDGPYLEEMKARTAHHRRIRFLGRVNRGDLPELYSASDCFVFPSVTDTFGMVVLEAQACGLPAIVSDFGGPQEIILNGKTGYTAKASSVDVWVEKLHAMIDLVVNYPALHREMRENARRHILSTYDWDIVLRNIFSRPRRAQQHDRRRPNESFADIVSADRWTERERIS